MVHDAGPARGRLTRLRQRFPDADAVVFGHSHMPLHEQDGGFPDLQSRKPDGAPARARAHHGPRAREGRGAGLRAGSPDPAEAAPAPAASCDKIGRAMDLDVLFAGTAASAPTARRGLSATLVRRGGERLLFDCGEGTQRQLVRSVGLVEIDEVYITHFHADHVLGLPGMLKTYGLQARERPLRVFGPRGPGAAVQRVRPDRGQAAVRGRADRAGAGGGARRATATGSPPSRWSTACPRSATR